MHAYEPIDHIDGLFGHDEFHGRHLGPNQATEAQMLEKIGAKSREQLITETVPAAILRKELLDLPAPATEADALAELKSIATKNEIWRSYIGAGYHGTFTPEPIRRNVLENPGWYTAYTPYQAEVAQGRLEALMNFQQMVVDLTGMHTSNASLLDEATAAAEAMATMKRACKVASATKFFIDKHAHPQVIAVMRTRAEWMGIDVVIGDANTFAPTAEFYGAHVQTPDTRGELRDFSALASALHAVGARLCVGTDLLALMLMKSPGAMGADVAIGTAQRFGIPMGYGGPHAAFMAVKEDLVRMMPGRIIGVSVDASGKPAYRMSLQTREQHIRRDKATSNICTAQALLANMASFFAVYHGPQGLHRIALRANAMARLVVKATGLAPVQQHFFDTVTFAAATIANVKDGLAGVRTRAAERKINLRYFDNGDLGLACDETTSLCDVTDLVHVLTGNTTTVDALKALKLTTQPESIAENLLRNDPVLTHPVFNSYHSETDFVRYMKRLENKDISLVHSMIPLGSCTMKLNAAAEMAPVTWPEFAALHPFAPADQAKGYAEMLAQLGKWLEEITGFDAVSFQPNSGAQGEYAGLLAIRFYQESLGQSHRDVCLIPSSAHGTNPASAQMMGMKIVVVACDSQGNVDVADLKAKIDAHKDNLSALMVTYPSTHGVFESAIKDICKMVHDAGGQVYMDGANLNAQAGLTRPGDIGADVCHMNLHKTFCIPHGGGGPGMGPIAVAKHLAPFLSVDPYQAGVRNLAASNTARNQLANSVSAAPFGSALITTISWMYIRMMGASGIRKATELAILNANYVAARLENYFPILYKGENGRIAHECILDLRHLKADCGITAEDIAKRLMDYGFHAPTLSFPVVDTLMVEPTESESKAELDRFCDAMIAIAGEIQKVRSGEFDKLDNPLKSAPHTAQEITGEWNHSYSRDTAVFPLPWVRGAKFWPSVKRIDNAAGDRNLVCTCPPVAEYA
jgi:glycine dehydrogenase